MPSKELLKYFLESVNETYYSFFEITEAGVIAKEGASGIERQYSILEIKRLMQEVIKRSRSK